MNAKITRDGELQVERAGKMEFQYCLYPSQKMDGAFVRCSDACPAFDEKFSNVTGEIYSVHLLCCGAQHEIAADERAKHVEKS